MEFINSLFNEDDISRLLFEEEIILQDASFRSYVLHYGLKQLQHLVNYQLLNKNIRKEP